MVGRSITVMLLHSSSQAAYNRQGPGCRCTGLPGTGAESWPASLFMQTWQANWALVTAAVDAGNDSKATLAPWFYM